jgi:hypothetical protein
VTGQLGAGRVVEPDVGGAEVLSEVGAGAGTRNEQDIRGEVEQPGERDLRRRRAKPYGQRGEHGVGEQPLAARGKALAFASEEIDELLELKYGARRTFPSLPCYFRT